MPQCQAHAHMTGATELVHMNAEGARTGGGVRATVPQWLK